MATTEKLSRLQRRALADAYAERGRKGLKRTVAGWAAPDHLAMDYYNASTIHSLVERGLLQLYVKGTCAHITDHGASVHDRLCEFERAAAKEGAA